MYFDEEKTLTESECQIVDTESCQLETVIKSQTIAVTECGLVEEERCLNVMDTTLEEECKVVTERECSEEQDDYYSITEDSECLLATGEQCVEDEAGGEAVVCETVLVEACPRQVFDTVPGNIDEYGAPTAPVIQQDTVDDCVPQTKQNCRKVANLLCAGNTSLSCSNVARELHDNINVESCQEVDRVVCRNVTHWGVKKQCHSVEVER